MCAAVPGPPAARAPHPLPSAHQHLGAAAPGPRSPGRVHCDPSCAPTLVRPVSTARGPARRVVGDMPATAHPPRASARCRDLRSAQTPPPPRDRPPRRRCSPRARRGCQPAKRRNFCSRRPAAASPGQTPDGRSPRDSVLRHGARRRCAAAAPPRARCCGRAQTPRNKQAQASDRPCPYAMRARRGAPRRPWPPWTARPRPTALPPAALAPPPLLSAAALTALLRARAPLYEEGGAPARPARGQRPSAHPRTRRGLCSQGSPPTRRCPVWEPLPPVLGGRGSTEGSVRWQWGARLRPKQRRSWDVFSHPTRIIL